MTTDSYRTAGGITIQRTVTPCDTIDAVEDLIDRLDSSRGALFSSSYEYPGRYTRWDMGFAAPPLVLTTRGSTFRVEALNERGQLLLPTIAAALRAGGQHRRPRHRR